MLDRESRELLERVTALGAAPVWSSTPEQARADFRVRQSLAPSRPAMHSVEDVEIPAGSASLPARVLTPTSEEPLSVILLFHGGGWVLGDLAGFEPFAGRLAAACDSTVVLVDYRLAPEHPFPAAAEDARGALAWAVRERGAAIPEVPLVVLGDSSGGNLAAGLVQLDAREQRAVDAQVLVYPVLDHDLSTPSYRDEANQLLVDRRAMEWYWDQYVPELARRDDPLASPGKAADLTGLPPTMFVAAEHDVLRDEGEVYVKRLRAAGVPTVYRVFTGQMHGFFSNALLPRSQEALAFVADELRRLLGDH